MAANNLLDKALPIYHRFVDNQVLTDNQLNEVLDHINFQDKLTRTGMVGVGILCGLNITTQGNTIQLNHGIAITTDGDLLKKKSTTYKGFKEFKDESVKYGHFLQGEKSISLYELEENTSASDVTALSQFQSKTGIAKESMVAILYLETFLKEAEDCSPKDCDAQGREVAQNLRVLVTSLDLAKTVTEKDSIFSGLVTTSGDTVIQKIDAFFSKRVVLNSGTGDALASVKNAYGVDFKKLFNRIDQLSALQLFKPFANESGFKLDQAIGKLIAQDLNFQYVHDFHKDLATAYNELLMALKEQYTICCPDPLAFPKHVLLGEVHASTAYFRHAFYPSPIHDHRGTLEKLQGLFKRIMHLIKHFTSQLPTEIRITPSRNATHGLGGRALPFYYRPSKPAEYEELLDSWKAGRKEKTWNYQRAGYATPEFDPLDYSLDDHDFLRIEGHVGKDVTGVISELQNIRAQKGLAFDIMPIAVGREADDATLDFDKFNMHFEDLQVILQAWNEEQKCIVKGSSDFLTKFSAKKEGLHLDYPVLIAEVPATPPEITPDITRPVVTQPTPGGILAGGGNVLGIAQPTGPFVLRGGVSTFGNQPSVLGGRAFAGTRGFGRKSVAIPRTNSVIENIATVEDSTGARYAEIINRSDGVGDIKIKIEEALGATVKDWSKEIREAAFDIPRNLIPRLKETEDHKLLNIEDFTEENLKKYIEALEAQCAAAKKAKKDLQKQVSKENSKLADKQYLENYFFVLNRIISSCCLVERVKVLYEKILERKDELLAKMVLKEYIKSHPGAEHKAGVRKGGTFVVLYHATASRQTAENTSVFDIDRLRNFDIAINRPFPLEPIRPITNRPLGGPFIENLNTSNLSRERISLADRIRPLSRRVDLADIHNLRDISLVPMDIGRFGTPVPNVSHGTVIGDLCLPYICCTDTPATTFVYPDQAVNLFIGQDHVCIPVEGKAEEVLLEVSPADGVVTTHIDKRELEGTIIKKNGSFFFDPNKVPESDFGDIIIFEVNGQKVPEQLRVLRKPTAGFSVNEEVRFSNGNTQATITVKNNSAQFTGQQFVWDFDQGLTVNQNATEFPHTYNVDPGGTFSFNITLTASNASCADTATQTKVIIVPQTGEDSGNCAAVTERVLKESKRAIDLDIEKNPTDLKNLREFHQTQFEPMYKLIFNDFEKTLEGALDSDIFGSIENIQKTITELLTVNRNFKEQEFLLRLYYESMLIYFHIQACREKPIAARTAITDRWLSFTKNAADTFVEAFSSLLKAHQLGAKLLAVRTKEEKRLSGTLKDLLDAILKTLKEQLG